ncbi:MAG: TolC family protein [Gammaproteobacteria bacterium]|nr:TolC family protein [Gammaproteobacteria bacterium]
MLQKTLCLLTALLLLAGNVFSVEPTSNTAAGFDIPAESADDAVYQMLTLRDAVEIALTDNQRLAELRFLAEALGAVPLQAGALPDPALGLNALNFPTDTFDRDQEPMTQLQVTLSQTFPFPGKRGLKREAAQYEAAAAMAQVLDTQLQIAADVRSIWWELLYLDRALLIVDQNRSLMRDFVEIAQIKYKVGSGLQQDVLLAQLELSRLVNRELPLQGMRSASEAVLNALLNLPATQAIRLPQEPQNESLPELPGKAQLLKTALETRPLLDVQREMTEAARIRLDLAKKDYYPDFKLGAGYGFRDGDDPVRGERADFASIMFSVNVPIYFKSKQSKAVDQRSSEYFRRKHAFNETLRSVQSAVSRNLAQYQASRDQVALYGTAIIPQAQQTVSAMLSAYQVNEVDFLNVLNAQITLYNAQISYWEAMSKARQSLAKLAASVGSEKLYE